MRQHIENIYASYVDIYGHSPCTQAFQRFLDTDCPLTNRKDFTNGYLVASAIVWHGPTRTVLRVLHAKIGRWVYSAGGGVNEGELPWQAAERELLEETGIKAHPLFDIEYPVPLIINTHTFPAGAVPGKPSHPIFDLIYPFCTEDKQMTIDPKEIKDYRWESPDNVILEYSPVTLSQQMNRYISANGGDVLVS